MASKGKLVGTIVNPAMGAIKGTRSKLDVLDSPNLGTDFGALTYPRDIDNQSGHFMMFHIVRTIPGSGRLETPDDKVKAGIDKQPVVPYTGQFSGQADLKVGNVSLTGTNRQGLTAISGEAIQKIAAGGIKRIAGIRQALKQTGASASDLTKIGQKALRSQTVTTIVIYMPEKITTGYSLDYQGANLRIAAAGAKVFELTANALGLSSTLTAEQSADLVKSLTFEFGTSFGKKLIDDLGSFAGADIGAQALFERNVRKVFNPHMQFLFKAVNQRTFEYTFQFVAQSPQESEIIDNIIRTFKFFSHPEVTGPSGRLHSFPAEFDIQYVSRELIPEGQRAAGHQYHFQENNWLNRIGRCYLSGMTVDYSGAGVFATHRHHQAAIPETLQGASIQLRDGNPPTHVTMTLTFQELETLNRQHILEGF